jgi:hypothetical protein
MAVTITSVTTKDTCVVVTPPTVCDFGDMVISLGVKHLPAALRVEGRLRC